MTADVWAVVPAAGMGSRMSSAVPKQYLPLLNKTVIEFSVGVLLSHPAIVGCVVVIGEDDHYFSRTCLAKHPKVITTVGGDERADSVLAGLEILQNRADANDWVLVHDAARPCLQHSDIDALLASMSESVHGGILAQAVVETVKSVDGNRDIVSTLDRRTIFLAQTPQCFRLMTLASGYRNAIMEGASVTDEASVIERLGLQSIVVPGDKRNLKITHPQDLELAEFYLRQMESE